MGINLPNSLSRGSTLWAWSGGVFVAAAALGGWIAASVLANAPFVVETDHTLAAWLHTRAAPSLTQLMILASLFGEPVTVIGCAALTGLFLGWRGYPRRVLVIWCAVPIALLINLLIKISVQRHRPIFDDPLHTLTTYSFPSGHAVGSTVFYGMLVVWVFMTAKSPVARLVATLGGVTLVTIICFSRLYLGVHYLSDVLAGTFEGIALLALAVAVVNRVNPIRMNRQADKVKREG